MCGIFGVIEWERKLDIHRVLQASDCLRHRGPDESGFLFDHVARAQIPDRAIRFLAPTDSAPWQLGFGHRRLSIIDLTAGQQPMLDASGEWAIIFNGEIYNHLDLRKTLVSEGATFLTDHSDTETLLVGFARWGPALLPKLNGMFAAAIYHRTTAKLWLIRDRFGKKPLYLLHQDGRLAFASELKALVSYLGSAPLLDLHALGDYMMRSCIHEPRTIFQGVSKVPAASLFEFDLSTPGGRLVSNSRFWQFQPAEPAGDSASEQDLEAEFEELLDDAVKLRLLSDVPVGAFLSSGLDSATVCALASKHVSQPLRAFTIGTDDPATDESADAARVAAILHLKHITDKCALDPQSLLSDMVTAFDEPFADLSMAPTLHVARLAARQVKVVLTGDGADEFFAGYPIFSAMSARKPWEAPLTPLARAASSILPLGARGTGFLNHNFPGAGLTRYRSYVENPKMLTLLAPALASQINPAWPRLDELWKVSENFDPLTRISLLQGMTYLTDDILVKVDRATMASSLEARAPFLDYRIVEFTARLPARLKVADGRGKVILRRLARRWFPESYLNKPKRGFLVPLKKWMQTEMRDELDSLASTELFSARDVKRLVSLQLKTNRDYSSPLWRLLVLNRWLKQWKPAPAR